MYLIGVLVLSAKFLVCRGWIQELSGKELEIGNGITFKLDPVNVVNASLLEKLALRIDYSGMGVSIAKTPDKDTLEVGFYFKEGEEARSKKTGQLIVPILAGFKITALGAIMMAAVGGLVLQSLMVAKLSLMVSSILAIYKLFGSKKGKDHVTVEHVQHVSPVVYSYPSIQEFSPISTGNYVGYANYPPSGHDVAAESGSLYTVVEAPDANATQQLINLNAQAVPLQRRHLSKSKLKSNPYLDIKRHGLK